jgi:2,6-dihydroxypyridine 3-monooxygenase
MEPISVQIVGGSLGGLTAACLLRDAGHDVAVHERSSRELEQRGAGIGFLPATYRYLVERAGVDLTRISVATDHIRYLAHDGSIVSDARHRYLFSSWNTVYRELRAAYGASPYLLGHELVDLEQDVDGVVGRYADGTARRTDLLVAADGVGSLVREQLQPQARRRYAGYVAWRGMVPESDLDPGLVAALGDAITYHVLANSHILVYPIPNVDGSVEVGSRMINFVWYRNYLEGGDLDDLMTDRDGVRRDLSVPPGYLAARHVTEARAVAAARLPPVLAEVVHAVDEPFIQTIHDIEVDRMAFGRVCLIGDAAFAVRPHAAAGTAKAADDGWKLAAALDRAPDLPTALAAWEAGQLELGRDLLDRTRDIGARSQVSNTWEPGDPSLIFGLYGPGD